LKSFDFSVKIFCWFYRSIAARREAAQSELPVRIELAA